MTRDGGPRRISKTQRKRHSESLQRLGEALIQLPPDELDALGLPAELRDALEVAARVTRHGAQRRQRQYIGRLMRDIDPAPIQAYLERRQSTRRVEQRHFRETERWRDRLLADDETVIAECAAATGADPARLSELRRTARHAHKPITRKTASRALFRYLHALGDDGDAR